MQNIVFIDINECIEKSVKHILNSQLDLKYINPKCAVLKHVEKRNLNIWITIGLYNKYNLMTYNHVHSGYLLVYDTFDCNFSILNKLNNVYNQLIKKTSNIEVIMITSKEPNISFKKDILKWCINKVPGGIPYTETNNINSLNIY